MRRLHFLLAFLPFALTDAAAADPVATCREKSDTDEARIDCLEDALRALLAARTAAAGQTQGAAPDMPAGLGAEQVIARERIAGERPQADDRSFTADIVMIEYTNTGRPVFTLANDQIWQGMQPDPRYQRFTMARHKRVEVTNVKLGGYRLVVEGVKRQIAVERIK